MTKATEVLNKISEVTMINVDSRKGPTKFSIAETKDGFIGIKPMNSAELYFLTKEDAVKMASELSKLSK